MRNANRLDRRASAFRPHHLDVPMGRRHDIDEGEGEPIVLVRS